jgi:predicted ATP-grasp superfamily ATP-dependent carboligase
MYLQQLTAGIPGSIIFASSRNGAKLLGLTRQLVGDPAFGAGGYRYCGSILASEGRRIFPSQVELLQHSRHLADVLTREFQLVGLNGADFIARNGVPHLLEVNPRFSASMELVERASGFRMFDAHVAACRGTPPPSTPALRENLLGKAIVFARRSVRIDLAAWRSTRWMADLPHDGEEIPQGRPICTVLAEAASATRCYQLLARRAAGVYRRTGPALSRAS